MNPFTAIPAHVRRWLYLTWGVAGLAAGSIGAYTSVTPADDTPSWLGGAVAVIATVGTGLGFTAAANTVETTAQKDPESPTGEVAGESSPLPTGTPVETSPVGEQSSKDYTQTYGSKSEATGYEARPRPLGYSDGI